MIKDRQKFLRLRLAGFAGEWERKKLGELVNVFDNLRIPVAENKRIVGDTPYFGANGIQDYVDGFTHDGEFVLIAEDGANDLKNYPVQYLNGKAWVNNHAHVLQGKPELFNNLFLFSRFQSMDISRFLVGGGRAKLNAGVMLEIEIEFPTDKKEQTAIGEFFQHLDRLQADARARLEKSSQLKKAMLAKMFPASGQKTPPIRLKGFTGDWERRKLGELCNITTGKLDANAMKENGEYDFFTSGIKKYKIDHYAFVGPAITIAGNGATVGYMHYADGYFNAYQRTYVLTSIQANRNFIFYEIKRKLKNKIKEESRAGNIPYIVLEMLTELSVLIPTPEEQTAIGNFFQQLDRLLALQQAEVEKLTQLKKAMLAAMLV